MRLARSDQRAGERHSGCVAFNRKRFDRGAAGIGQAEELRGLVERFPDSVVDGGCETPIVADPADFEALAEIEALTRQIKLDSGLASVAISAIHGATLQPMVETVAAMISIPTSDFEVPTESAEAAA
jgi:hypothetical protein